MRAQRALLLHTEFAYNKDGSFGKHTRSQPTHREMRDAWAVDKVDPDSDEFIGTVRCSFRCLAVHVKLGSACQTMFGLRLWPLKVMKAVALTLHQPEDHRKKTLYKYRV